MRSVKLTTGIMAGGTERAVQNISVQDIRYLEKYFISYSTVSFFGDRMYR